jgi:hypothetical protein
MHPYFKKDCFHDPKSILLRRSEKALFLLARGSGQQVWIKYAVMMHPMRFIDGT